MTYSKRWMLSIVVVLALGTTCLNAQETTTALSGEQQSAAKTALCSAIASKFPNPSAAGPSA
jgi:nitrous oxide reductase accessory protein NosL